MLSATISLILLTVFFSLSYFGNYLYLKNQNQNQRTIDYKILRQNFMGTILIIFGLLKLFNLKGFANIFQKYDLISNKIPQYAYIYPFIELGLGISYLKKYKLNYVNAITTIVMAISIVSVVLSMVQGKKLRCGCLGAFFHIPLSYVTLSENIVMMIMVLMIK